MKTKKQIFTVFVCDEWKMTTSMKLVMCTTSAKKLKSFIAKKIKEGEFEYSNGTELSKTKQVEMFKSDFEKETRNTINDRLRFGFYDYCYDGEEM